MSRTIDKIIVHCSDSRWGDAAIINEWHVARGWKRIGYHYVILNGYLTGEEYRNHTPQPLMDGVVQIGRGDDEPGAHCYGQNVHSIGICLIGDKTFTAMQLNALRRLIWSIWGEYGRVPIFGHYEKIQKGQPPKTCPNIDMNWLRNWIDHG